MKRLVLLAMLLSATVALAACGDKQAPSAPGSDASAPATAAHGGNVLRYAMSFKEKGSLAIESDAALRCFPPRDRYRYNDFR